MKLDFEKAYDSGMAFLGGSSREEKVPFQMERMD
jgi:hypothetical protein